MFVRTALVLIGAISLVGCSAIGGGPPLAPGGGGSSELPVLTITDAIVDGPAVDVGQSLGISSDLPIRVTGALFVAPDGTVLLCSAIAESFPPQCAGDRIEIAGLDLAAVELETANDVSWSESVELIGQFGG